MIQGLVRANRSYRRFHEEIPVEIETLRELVDLARLCPSASNLQPLKYVLVSDSAKCTEVLSCLAWAGYLKDWPGPKEGERPSAYIVILGDTRISRSIDCDHGIAAQTVLLGATEKGLGGCIVGSIDKERLRDALAIPAHLDVLLVIAIGKPKETVVIETVGADGDIKYWRDEDGTHHVPKRGLDEVIVGAI